jgi:hypothetical protein
MYIKRLFLVFISLVFLIEQSKAAESIPDVKPTLNAKQRRRARRAEKFGHSKVATMLPGEKIHKLAMVITLDSVDAVQKDTSTLNILLGIIAEETCPIITTTQTFNALSAYINSINPEARAWIKASSSEAEAKQKLLTVVRPTEDLVYTALFCATTEFSDNNYLVFTHNEADFVLLIPKKLLSTPTPETTPESTLAQLGFSSNTLTQITSGVPATIITQKGYPEGFVSALKKLFLPLGIDVQKSWNIFAVGHGDSPKKVDGSINSSSGTICGIPITDFQEIITFFNGKRATDIQVSFFYYLSCFAAGANLSFINTHLKSIKANFLIATQGMNENITYGSAAAFNKSSANKDTTSGVMDFTSFFARLNDFFDKNKTISTKKDPIAYILEPLHRSLNNRYAYAKKNSQAFIRFPNVGTFQASKANDYVSTLTQSTVKGRELEGKPFDYSNTGILYIVNYAKRIGVPLILSQLNLSQPNTAKKRDLILALPSIHDVTPYSRLYIFEEIIDTTNSKESFINNFCNANASFLPVTVLIKKLVTFSGETQNLLINFEAIGDSDSSFNKIINKDFCDNNSYPIDIHRLAKTILEKSDLEKFESRQKNILNLVTILDSKLDKNTIGGLSKIGIKDHRLTSLLTRLEAQLSNANIADFINSKTYSIENHRQMLLTLQEQVTNIAEQLDSSSTLQIQVSKLHEQIRSAQTTLETIFAPMHESIDALSESQAITIVNYLLEKQIFLATEKCINFIKKAIRSHLLDKQLGNLVQKSIDQQLLPIFKIILTYCTNGDRSFELKITEDEAKSADLLALRCLNIMTELVDANKSIAKVSTIADSFQPNKKLFDVLGNLYTALMNKDAGNIEKAMAVASLPQSIFTIPYGLFEKEAENNAHEIILKLYTAIIDLCLKIRQPEDIKTKVCTGAKQVISWIKGRFATVIATPQFPSLPTTTTTAAPDPFEKRSTRSTSSSFPPPPPFPSLPTSPAPGGFPPPPVFPSFPAQPAPRAGSNSIPEEVQKKITLLETKISQLLAQAS